MELSTPESQGIYFLFDGDECVYVGSATNIRQRFKSHTAAAGLDRCEYILLPESIVSNINRLHMVEQFFIECLQPRLNTMWVPTGKHKTRKPQSKKDQWANGLAVKGFGQRAAPSEVT